MAKEDLNMGQIGIFDFENRMNAVSQCGDPLEGLNGIIKWSIFLPLLKKPYKQERKSNAGRPPFDYLKMFKVLVLQRLHNLSDHQMEFQLKDRLSFGRFVGFGQGDRLPDEKTIWLFRETLAQHGVIEKLFNRFDQFLEEQGYTAKKGMIVDASIVEVPKQRNSRDENQELKKGRIPEDWGENKQRQKDTDAHWCKKHGQDYYGYKNHINIDVKHKLIRKMDVTSANIHDSQVFEKLLDPWNSDSSVWADSAYPSEGNEDILKELWYRSHIHKKGCRYKPLSSFQENLNRKKSAIRARVEHVFGFMENTMKSKLIRGIGIARARCKITLVNLVYNISRYHQLEKIAT
jgi:IS5 family transposase